MRCHPAQCRRRCACSALLVAAVAFALGPPRALAIEPAATPEDVVHFLHAVGEGDREKITGYLGRGLANAASPDGETPLHVAGIRGDTEVVKQLVDAGAALDPRAWGERSLQMTPLTWFVYGNHHGAAKVLLEAGANANMVVFREDGSKITALDIAGIIQNQEIAELLKVHGALTYEECERAAAGTCAEPPRASQDEL